MPCGTVVCAHRSVNKRQMSTETRAHRVVDERRLWLYHVPRQRRVGAWSLWSCNSESNKRKSSNGRTKGPKGRRTESCAATWRRRGWAASGGWRRSAAATGLRLGGRGRSNRTNDGRDHRTLHTQTHHQHALRLQKWRSTSRFLPRCVVDYGFLLRRKVLGGQVRNSHSLWCLQCDTSYQGSALCLSSNEVLSQGRTKSGVPAAGKS